MNIGIKRHGFFAFVCGTTLLLIIAYFDRVQFSREQEDCHAQEKAIIARMEQEKIAQEKNKHDEVESKNDRTKQFISRNPLEVKNAFLEKAMNIAQDNGLFIQSLKTKSNDNDHFSVVYLKMKGDLSKLFNFLSFLSEGGFLVLSDNVTLKASNELSVLLDTTLSIYPFSRRVTANNDFAMPIDNKLLLKLKENPNRDMSDVQEEDLSSSLIPLKQLSFVGSARLKKEKWAWLRLPSQHIISVRLFDTIGIEKARVIQITEQFVMVSFDHHLYQI